MLEIRKTRPSMRMKATQSFHNIMPIACDVTSLCALLNISLGLISLPTIGRAALPLARLLKVVHITVLHQNALLIKQRAYLFI